MVTWPISGLGKKKKRQDELGTSYAQKVIETRWKDQMPWENPEDQTSDDQSTKGKERNRWNPENKIWVFMIEKIFMSLFCYT